MTSRHDNIRRIRWAGANGTQGRGGDKRSFGGRTASDSDRGGLHQTSKGSCRGSGRVKICGVFYELTEEDSVPCTSGIGPLRVTCTGVRCALGLGEDTISRARNNVSRRLKHVQLNFFARVARISWPTPSFSSRFVSLSTGRWARAVVAGSPPFERASFFRAGPTRRRKMVDFIGGVPRNKGKRVVHKEPR